MLFLSCSRNLSMYLLYCIFQVDKRIRELDLGLARFEAEIQRRTFRTSRNVDESLQKRRCSEIYFIMMLMCLTISLCMSFSGGNYTKSEEETATHKTSAKKQTQRSL